MPKVKPAPPVPLASDLLPPLEMLPLASLRPHPRNTQTHPEDQLAHLRQSLTNHGVYRNIVVARDGTILAGHGVVLAAQQLGYTALPGRRLDLEAEDPLAWQVLIGDNHAAQLSQRDDVLLAALLQEMQHINPALLLGTGFDTTAVDTLLALLADQAGGPLDDGSGGGEPGGDTFPGEGSLVERFGVPPFSVLDARQGYWQDRKRGWLALGIQSELGRGGGTWRESATGSPLDRQREYSTR